MKMEVIKLIFHQKPVTFVSEVSLKVQNLKRSLDFYENIIGFKVLKQTETTAHLTADGKTVLVKIEQPENVIPKQERTTGLYHFALLLPTRPDLANFLKHYMKTGLQLGASDHLVSEALYLSDVDGNGIEVYADRDPTKWTWKKELVEMVTDPLNFSDLISKATGEWKGLPSNTIMGHIHLHVADLQEAEQFYIDGLGFDIVSRYGNQALFISDGNYHHHIGLNIWNGVGAPKPDSNSAGMKSYTIVLEDEKKRSTVATRLENIGASLYIKDDTYITEDPSGNKIILQI